MPGRPGSGLKWEQKAKIRAKLLSRRKIVGDCWEYANPQRRLYPAIRVGGSHVCVSKAALWAWKGKRSEWRQTVAMHSCDNPRCFNPDHLSLGTYLDNLEDAQRKGRRKVRTIRTHDIHGHELTEANTYWSRGQQYCRICRAKALAKRRDKHRAAKEANASQ